MTLIELLRTGAKSTGYLCKYLECDLVELWNTITILQFAGYKIDSFEEGYRIYIFLEE